MLKSGLVYLKSSNCLPSNLELICKYVQNHLYVLLVGDQKILPLRTWENILNDVYIKSYCKAPHLDIKLHLHVFKDLSQIRTKHRIECVFYENGLFNDSSANVTELSNQCLSNVSDSFETISLPNVVNLCNESTRKSTRRNDDKAVAADFGHAVLGGTFDHLHSGHKYLLSIASVSARDSVTVGVTSPSMTKNKVLNELIEPLETRIKNVQEFLKDTKPDLKYDVVAIEDMYGPTKYRTDFDLIVVSEETLKGAQKINEYREQNHLRKLHIYYFNVLYSDDEAEEKISSRRIRKDLLGRLMRPVTKEFDGRKQSYVIGLTGSIASGKSSIAKQVQSFEFTKVINCDTLAHDLYKPSMPCYHDIIAEFGDGILDSSQFIDRKKLGTIVFTEQAKLHRLNQIVWPYINKELEVLIRKYYRENFKIIVIEAALLLQANWDEHCHEVWVTFIPENEALTRLKERNQLSESDARVRLQALPDNRFYIEKAHVLISTSQPYAETSQLLRKSWNLLLHRISV